MKWIKFTLETTSEAIDILSYELDLIGVEGIEIKDNLPCGDTERAKKFGEILPETAQDDGKAVIYFYKEPPCNTEKLIKQVNSIYKDISAYCDIGKGTVKAEETEDIDWLSNWKKYFKPFRATENIIVKPTWENITEKKDSDILIEIDPGTAFGTGSHETTLLCIQSLEKYVKPDMQILDIGCGSGILMITAMKLGAGSATGIDIDQTAIEISKENLLTNHLEEEVVRLFTGNITTNEKLRNKIGFGCYDIIVANILADILIPLSSVIRPHMKKDGLYITSGIINTKENEVRRALLANGFEIVETVKMKEWISLICR